MASSSKVEGKPERFVISFKPGEDSSLTSVRINADGQVKFLDADGSEAIPEEVERQVQHDRTKGPKVRSKAPLLGDSVSFDGVSHLEMYDKLIGIDTNTTVVGDRKVSISAYFPFVLNKVQGGFQAKQLSKHVQLLEVVGEIEKPELFAVAMMVSMREFCDLNQANQRIGIITDTELGKLDQFNQRLLPIYGAQYLPMGVQFLYASSDVGSEIPNKVIRMCDTAASQSIREIDLRRFDEPRSIRDPVVAVRKGYGNAVVTLGQNTLSGATFGNNTKVRLFGIPR